jgi:DNA-binding NtrC family response regulator
MLQLDELMPDWSLLFAIDKSESQTLLSIVLSGFGYQILECQNTEEAVKHFSDQQPFAAIVDMSLQSAAEICSLIHDRGGMMLVILLDDDYADPQQAVKDHKADAWEYQSAKPERLLTVLKNLVAEKEDLASTD